MFNRGDEIRFNRTFEELRKIGIPKESAEYLSKCGACGEFDREWNTTESLVKVWVINSGKKYKTLYCIPTHWLLPTIKKVRKIERQR